MGRDEVKWTSKIGIGSGVVLGLAVLTVVVSGPLENWWLKRRVWVAFGVKVDALQAVDLPDPETGRPFAVPALQAAAERRFPLGTSALELSNRLARVFGPSSVHISERTLGDRRLSCGFDVERGWWYRDRMWVEFSLDSSNRVRAVVRAGYQGITI